MCERFTRRCIQRCASILVCALPTLGCAKDLAPNTGHVELVGNITMQVQTHQHGGACASGYAWHTTYGGCRRAVLEQAQQREPCGVDYTGEQIRTRARTQYVLQSTGQAANDPWEAWSAWDRSACVAVSRRASGVTPGLITLVLGLGVSGNPHRHPTPQASPLQLPRGTRGGEGYYTAYAVTLDRTTAQLRCVYSLTTGGASESEIWTERYAWLLGIDESVHTAHGHCQLSQGKMQARIFGDCDEIVGVGSEWAVCARRTHKVSILAVNPCSVTVEVLDVTHPHGPQLRTQHEYPVCS